MISSIYGKAVLALALIWTDTAAAAEHRLSGRWRDGSNSVGVIQSGRTVFVFSKGGWSAGALDPRGAGFLANGEGMWTFDARPEPATVTVGEQDGRLFIIVAPAGARGGPGIKMILKLILPEVPPEKVLTPITATAASRGQLKFERPRWVGCRHAALAKFVCYSLKNSYVLEV